MRTGNLFLFYICITTTFKPISTLQKLYSHARVVRIQQGAAAAAPLYQRILLHENPSDLTTASHLAASATAQAQLGEILTKYDVGLTEELRKLLDDSRFNTETINQHLGVSGPAASSIAPLHISPAAAGTVSSFPWGKRDPSIVECLVALFLVGLAIPSYVLEKILSPKAMELLFDLKIVARSQVRPDLLFAQVQIFPLSLSSDMTIYLLTDWHPRVLSQTSINNAEDAVMYIGPDSVALVQHYLMNDNNADPDQPTYQKATLLDLCTGSGVQALAALRLGKCRRAVAVDVNPRCMRFTNFNAELNGLKDHVELICGDIIQGHGYIWRGQTPRKVETTTKLIHLLNNEPFHIVTANPPFLPVPPALPRHRHGLFSAGGGTGEVVLASIVELASQVLSIQNGTLAIVSEFFLSLTGSADALLQRIEHWCSTGSPGRRGLLLTNEEPIQARAYAERRSDSLDEFDVWMNHFASLSIGYASPGLLYICIDESVRDAVIVHVRVPKSKQGSIWSPGNWDAVEFTRRCFRECLTKER